MTTEDILNKYNLGFRGSGKDYLIKCLNPEHDDKNPSLRVDKISGIFNCLSCGFSGNIFKHFDESQDNVLDIRRAKLKSLIVNKRLNKSEVELPGDHLLFNNEWRGISAETLNKFGAFISSKKEFKDRICFPITNLSNKIIGFCSRSLTNADPKYLFSPTGVSFPLFPVVTPINNKIILVEGIFDMINLHDKGLTNTVCMFGVNKLNHDKLDLLGLQGITGIDIFLDNDTAGHTAAKKIKEFIDKKDFKTRNITFGNINDPGDLTAQQVIKLKEKLYNVS